MPRFRDPAAALARGLLSAYAEAMRFQATIAHTSVYPDREPPAILVAKLPGSM